MTEAYFFNIIGEYAVFGHNYIEKEDFHYENDISAKEETAFQGSRLQKENEHSERKKGIGRKTC